MVEELAKFVKRAKHPEHCRFCEGIDESIENPRHHSSYEMGPLCNLNCLFCYSRIAEKRGVAPREGYYGEMNPKAITISQFGEPFFYGSEKLLRVIRGLREIFGDVRIDIQTNGTMFDERVAEEADIVMISLDAGSRESYARITGRDLFESVLESIRRSSEITYTSVRTVFIPGLNDGELEKIAEISSSADELFLQPVSLYRDNQNLLRFVDLERTESMAEFLETAAKLSEIADVRIPGCLLLNLRNFLKEYGSDALRFLRRDAFGEFPSVQREWRFRL